MNSDNKRFLYCKLASSTLRAAFLWAALSSLIIFLIGWRQAGERADATISQLLAALEQAAVTAANANSREQAEYVLEQLLRSGIIQSVRLYSAHGLALHRNRGAATSDRAEIARSLHPPGGGQVIGQIAAVADEGPILREALHATLLGALSSILFIGLTAFSVLHIVRNTLSRPLLTVSDALHAITAGKDTRLPQLQDHRDDELGRLVADINGLLDRLHQHFAAQHALLRFSLDHVNEGAFLVDEHARICDVNAEASRALGYSREELLRMSIPDIDPEFPVERWREEGFKVTANHPLTFETVHRAANGRIFPVEVTANYFEYEDRAYNLAMARDITERKQAEQALRASEERFRHLFENSTAAYQSLDIQGRYLDVNPGLCRLLGYEREELLGRGFDEFWADDLKGDFHREFDGFKRHGRVNNELQLRRKDGNILTIALDGIIQRDEQGNFVRTHCLLHDITAYKTAEKALMHYAAIIESSDDAIVGKDLEGKVASWNQGAERLFGYRQEEMLGQSIAVLIPEDLRQEERMILDEVRQGRTMRYETVRRRKDGTELDVSVTVSPVKDNRGDIVGASKIARDITEWKKAAAELQRHREHLEELVAERTAALEVANGELEAFSYSVSHDLRTPLRAIDGFSLLLARNYGDRLDGEGLRLIRVVRDNTARMAQLIDDLLAFARAGRIDLNLAMVDMETLVKSVWTELEPLRAGRDIRLDLKPLPPAMGDAAMLKQAWINLLGNAVKFTQPQAAGHIQVDSFPQGREIAYRIQDNGVGFDPAYTHKLFGVFQRLHAVDEFEGTGIGLAIVKRIVKRHGGHVGATARPGEGASFHFTLPAP